MRDKLVKQREIVCNIEQQIDLANDALRLHDLDFKYLKNDTDSSLTCPTCGAEHSESFLDYFTYAEDARVLRELVITLRTDAAKAQFEHQATKSELSILNANYQRVSEILSTRKGEVKFKDVIDSAGAERAFKAFHDEEEGIKRKVLEVQSSIDTLDERLSDLVNKEKSKEILTSFREAYVAARRELNLPPVEVKKLRLTSRPDLSGSGGPRSILAYYAAIWKTCSERYGTFAIPIIIDSPNQQGQDDINMPAVLKFISSGLPRKHQVIVSSEGDTDFEFDKRFLFDEQYRLLQESGFEGVRDDLEPLVERMFKQLKE